MAHDYNPEWDYELDRRPSPDVVDEVQATLCRYAHVFERLGLSCPTVYYVKRCGRGMLAKYVSGTRDEPVVVVDAKAVIRTARKYDVALCDGVESTIMHEVGHAYLDSVDAELPRNTEEEVVERFAHTLWRGHEEAAITGLTSTVVPGC